MIQIIPAIDIINGQCVRLTEGDFAQQKTYASNPVEVAKQFEGVGLTRLHLVDLDGARAKEPKNLAVLEAIATQTNLTIDFGGGIQNDIAIQQAFNAGAHQITAGSIAVREPGKVQEWLVKYGAEKIIIGADFRDNYIAINAWADQSTVLLTDFIDQYVTVGAKTFICTDVSKDGKLQGPATATYAELVRSTPRAAFIASGGVTTIQDLEELDAGGVTAAIIGKAIYEGTIALADLNRFVC
ncbi:1-(5-phosphoribosyl)-5-[(5-phosphoribosylamino)methylideneamino]imidazole-4-carboxamide isomerase [Adhaeribacter pallidiroseus]|uniref:1-(5-phosphoribosyl)-5-[(5-phosphoribosylamino)methylideneamino] imidazole-4-carboxamide isomerase n=1 Tax=Adhaeribacter pallidiroseus TaxID=2072847 RepID=A0A369QDU7_9BACT|nr:1-(5-phosphoribosyl)-5-[(5-phosphoribosylamino)methylideneamino]imidazole-4-carboxamide isomerase [Adhaeribacter pallidiroseus]RDC63081.1 1-(5-phosphoribosyl)-5-((5-phosphoribosylamino)methylideneamino)imidazole-4-carboxamideisomerase [Adhaeribacter pallidiroseus]